MARIVAVSVTLPPHEVTQDRASQMVESAYAGHGTLQRFLRVFATAGVERRYFVFPPDRYLQDRGFEERNRDFIEQAGILAERAARSCLEKAETAPQEVDHLILVTTTGLATPSLDVRLASRLGLRPDVRRWPLFGLGCAGGAGALSRAADVLRGAPRERALVISVELCGQVFTPRAASATDVIGAALFGDGAASALVVGDDLPGKGPRLAASRSVLFEGTEHLMGWAFTGDGLRLVLSTEVTDFVQERLKPAVDAFLSKAGAAERGPRYWVLHPGGRKVIDTYASALGLGEDALAWTRRSLARVGNLSSASVLFILNDVMEIGRPRAGEKGLMCALGPGFSAELALLQW